VTALQAFPPVATPVVRAKARLGWVDAAKGIGIVLVVYGHAVDGLRSAGLVPADGWAAFTFYAIYTFHMPLFFLLSGLFVPGRLQRDRARFVWRLFPTIAYPYFLWSIVQVTILYLAAAYVNVPRTHLAYAEILWSPPSQFWFLYVLFLCHLAAAASVWKGSGALLTVIGIAAALFYYAAYPHATVVRCFAEFLIFYAVGVLYGQRIAGVQAAATRYWRWSAVAVLLAVPVTWFGFTHGFPYGAAWVLPVTAAGIAGTLSLSVALSGRPAVLFQFLGQRAMAIYVLHVLFVAGTRIVLAKLLGLEWGALLLPILVAAGLCGPVVGCEIVARLRLNEWAGLGGLPRRAKAAHG